MRIYNNMRILFRYLKLILQIVDKSAQKVYNIKKNKKIIDLGGEKYVVKNRMGG